MSGDRRQVRVSQTLFDRLDELFAEERSAEGAPSATDFLLHEIPAIIDRLADAFGESTTPFVAGSDIRVLVTAGVLVDFMAVYALLTDDGAVEIIYLEIETREPGGSS